MQLVEIDITAGTGMHGRMGVPGLEYGTRQDGPHYLAQINGILWFGHFEQQWYGPHFACGFGASGGFQFDAPGHNRSSWQRLWRLEQVPEEVSQ